MNFFSAGQVAPYVSACVSKWTNSKEGNAIFRLNGQTKIVYGENIWTSRTRGLAFVARNGKRRLS